MILAALALAACQLNGECDTADEDCSVDDSTQPFTGDVAMAQIAWGCCDPAEHEGCPSRGQYWYDVVTAGRAHRAVLDVSESISQDGHAEKHQLPVHTDDPDGWWEDRFLELAIADTTGCRTLTDCEDRLESGENTLFPCNDTYTGALMTWWIRIYEEGVGVPLGCATWGAEADTIAAQLDCEIVEL